MDNRLINRSSHHSEQPGEDGVMASEFDNWPLGIDASARGAPSGQNQPDPAWVELVTEDPSSEDEIGDILVKVQQFADETADEAERESQAILGAARAEAARLVDEANGRARSIVESAQQMAEQIVGSATESAAASSPTQQSAPVSSEAIGELSSAIAEYANTNRDLIGELIQLRDALGASVSPPAQPVALHRPDIPDLPR